MHKNKKDNRVIFVCPAALRIRLDKFLQDNPLMLMSNVIRAAIDEFMSKRGQ